MDDLIEEVLDLWFEGVVENEMREAWWVQDEAFDAEIRRWFKEVQRRASAGEVDVWTEIPMDTLAPVVVLDQFSRNLNSGSAAAVANDPKALAIAEAGIEKDWGGEFANRIACSSICHTSTAKISTSSVGVSACFLRQGWERNTRRRI